MNRTYSYGFRAHQRTFSKGQTPQMTSTSCFRTLWKKRDNHDKTLIETRPKKVSQTPTKQQAGQDATNEGFETAAQQEMKQFIKTMKHAPKEPCSTPAEAVKKPRVGSSRSVRSEARSCCDGRSVADPSENRHWPNLDELQQRAEELIQARLMRRSQTRTFFNSKVFEDDLAKDLKQLVADIRGYRSGSQTGLDDSREDQNIDASIREIGQKINIIEKIIAESYSESQLLKKYYMSKRSFRKQQAVCSPNSLKTNISLKHLSMSSSMLQSPSISYQTTNKASYPKPNRTSYIAEVAVPQPYLVNRQPLPRSHYQREYLYYGIVPTYSSKLGDSKVHLTHVSSTSSQKNSTYQREFGEKKQKLFDSKELDCRQDKIRNLKISFIAGNAGNLSYSRTVEAKKQKVSTKNGELRGAVNYSSRQGQLATEQSNKQNAEHFLKSLTTQHRHQFTGAKCTIDAFIKQKNLENLKYGYKFQSKA